jgi:hypothetical protein
MAEPALRVTRQSLHAVAELVLAGPQYRRSGTIRLAQRDGGFGTVTEPDLRVDSGQLVVGDRRLNLDGSTLAQVAVAAGVDVGRPEGVYGGDGSGASPQDVLRIDAHLAEQLAAWSARGQAAMRRLAPGQTPVLWPEHFDLAITENKIDYGVSPGDTWQDEPYAYVGPWERRAGDFWNAPFGAARPMSELPDVDAVYEFMDQGRRLAG